MLARILGIQVRRLSLMVLASVTWTATLAATFPLPPKGDDIIGQVQTTVVQQGDNFPKIAQRFNVTYTGLMEANPNVDPAQPQPGTVLIIPSQYILPDVPHKGIVVNVAELRLYYFPAGQNEVMTYPIGIGIQNWETPLGLMKIVEKQKDPTWYVPPDIKKELWARGFHVPNQIPAGPDNPLGDYMMRLSNWTYLIHGVVDPSTVGRRSSSGCMRMYPENIQELFNAVPMGTQVRIINQPYKVGWEDGNLFMEAHLPLQEQQIADGDDKTPIVSAINDAVKKRTVNINWDKAFVLVRQHMGLPEQIGQSG